ncbi:Pimeloyl-ACP methyl ester carboxylesterase [Flexibacter flexilis DSM 6793]|uniref:Pimeloyl-ACP methyl ester carboxylesterase n=1 Tax=Flexibacter flexilis DSM 6793 TaxID=927664 RepID=A0A1I1IWR2_9BACT|nr:alpha/beta hydrolase [Flexibacter flexilis]SFC40737.1 Pimeloyl-ACP methyl ester carboxylesterase [Flexibacter flexilis DSM 6793]
MSLHIVRHEPFAWKNTRLSYVQYGDGQRVLLAFHGFGQNKNAWLSVAQALGNEYCIYSFDLFFHGESIWPNSDEPIEKQDVKNIFEAFLQEKQIQQFGVMGFSLGAKIALCLAELFPTRLNQLILAAPDGLHINFWYRLATGSQLMRYIFKSLISNPDFFLNMVHWLGKARLVNKKLLQFALSQMHNPEKRRQVYYSWCAFRKLTPNVELIAANCNQRKIMTVLFVGIADNVIPHKKIKNKLKSIEYKKINILEANHVNLLQKVSEYYKHNLIQSL